MAYGRDFVAFAANRGGSHYTTPESCLPPLPPTAHGRLRASSMVTRAAMQKRIALCPDFAFLVFAACARALTASCVDCCEFMNFVTTSVIAPATASGCAMPCASDGT